MNSRSSASAVFVAQVGEIGRNRWIIAYTILLALLTESLYQLGGSGLRALAGMLNVVLLLVPLVTTVFAIVYWHSAREFIELLLAQPVTRKSLWTGLYLGLVTPLCLALVIGITLPLLIHGALDSSTFSLLAIYILTGTALTLCFGAASLWIATSSNDRLRALGTALGLWFLATIVYDGVVIWIATAMSDWPLEAPMLGLMLGNPIDLARTVLVLRLDSAAFLGYTGAILSQTLGGTSGIFVSVLVLFFWIATPVAGALRSFARKDF